jgi:glucose-6-phosphate 1-dehydrogenase
MTLLTEEETPKIVKPPGTILVIFGASGDLTKRKLIPALVNLAQDEFLSDCFAVVGASRSTLSDHEFRIRLLEALERYSRRSIRSETWEAFAKNVFYQPLDGENAADFPRLKDRLQSIEKSLIRERGECDEMINYLYYFATAPNHFAPIAANLKSSGLVEPPDSPRQTRIITEKPFGFDVPSARLLNNDLRESFSESQIFRIDHYLGKETVQNILVFRFANGMFEPLWNSRYIDCIQINVCEDIGVENRGSYFDSNGIVRDIVQNHVLQMLSLLCIEPPISLSDAASIRNEKVKVLKMVKRLEINEVSANSIRARYTKGSIGDEVVPGYAEEKGVSPESTTETYIALKLEIDNWRWSGVPIFIRAGKRLPKRITEIAVLFKRPPSAIFKGRQVGTLARNVLSIQVQPNEGISLAVNAKPPGPRLRVGRVDMDFSYKDTFGVPSPDAYERLLLDAMKGDATLFTRDDEIEVAWELLEPIFSAWRSSSPPPLYEYKAGSWGPEAADELINSANFRWRSL